LFWFGSYLANPNYNMILRPLPDVFIALKPPKRGHRKHYVLLVCREALFPVIHLRRIARVIRHLNGGDWEEEIKRPTLLILCETTRQQKLLQPRIAKAIAYAKLKKPGVYVSSETAVAAMDAGSDAVWQLTTDPVTMRSLKEM
jgi:hypothetical protein